MEGYSNYQAIINALKAEYVNARNLKKTAATKKRVATNAKSFKTRKENEKTSLETKLTSVENLLKSNLETSFTNLEEAKFDALKSELSELKGKLAFIDADIIRLEDQYDQDPENIGTFPKAAPTSIESQSLTVLRNMLSVTISDAESVINNLYSGQDYADIKSANVPTQLTHTEQEVINYYYNLQTTFDQVFEKTKDELDNFIIDIFTAGNSVNELRNQLIDHSGELVTLKSQLADLLTDNGTELELTAKEQQIEDLKEIMLTKATDMKQLEVSISSAWTDDKLVKLKRYATDLNSLTDELRDYRWDNHGFLKNQFSNPDLDTAYRSFELYSGFFEFMDNNQFLNTPRRFENGQSTEFKLLKQKITQAKDYFRHSSRFRDNAYYDTQVLYHTQQLFNCDQRNSGNGTEYYNITDFRPDVHQETIEFYVNYSRQLHNATSNYTDEMTRYKFYRNLIQQHIYDFDEIHDEQTINISALRSAKMEHLWKQDLLSKGINGHYEGTNEQDIVLDNTRAAWFEAEAEYLSQFYTNRSKSNKFDLFESIFPEFYSDLSGLESNLSQSYTNMTSSDTTYSDLITSKQAAYDYLQTLTVGEADYVAALADFESKAADFQQKWGQFGTMETELNQANDFLQTTLSGEAEYQAALPEILEPSTPPLYTQEYVDSVTALHYVYLGAQSDYDTKLAAKTVYYADIVIPAQTASQVAYDYLQTLTDEDAAYQAALTDWNSKVDSTNLFYNETYMPAHDAYNSAALELDQYLSSNHGSELNLSYSGSELKSFKDARDVSAATLEQANTIKSATEVAFIEARNSMTFVESTPLQKRQGMGMQKDVQKSNKQVDRLLSLANRYSELFPQMVNQAQSFTSEIRNRDEAYFAGLLGEVKDFLDGVYSNNFGQNLYVNKLNDYRVAEMHAGKFQSRLYTILGPVLEDWNMDFHNNNGNGNIADTEYDAIQELTTSDGISSLRQTISIINSELFRDLDGFSFADIIFNEVNNGTPLI
jgi:hypothetical protein